MSAKPRSKARITPEDLASLKFEASNPPVDLFRAVPDWQQEERDMRLQLAVVSRMLNADDAKMEAMVEEGGWEMWSQTHDFLTDRADKQAALAELTRTAALRIMVGIARSCEPTGEWELPSGGETIGRA